MSDEFGVSGARLAAGGLSLDKLPAAEVPGVADRIGTEPGERTSEAGSLSSDRSALPGGDDPESSEGAESAAEHDVPGLSEADQSSHGDAPATLEEVAEVLEAGGLDIFSVEDVLAYKHRMGAFPPVPYMLGYTNEEFYRDEAKYRREGFGNRTLNMPDPAKHHVGFGDTLDPNELPTWRLD